MTVLHSQLELYTLTNILLAEWPKSLFVETQKECFKVSILAHFLAFIYLAC